MNLLVTAGNTQVLIDRVRCLTNIFTGKTGARIALEADRRGHAVTLLTSHPEVVTDLGQPTGQAWAVRPYRTFEDLRDLMAGSIPGGPFDAIIHTAAVSDYLAGGVFAPATGTTFDPIAGLWRSAGTPMLVDRAAGKVKSNEAELWLRLVQAPKLIDSIRTDWAFRGVLVKFKLEVGVTRDALLDIAERSRRHSSADLMVANTLEGSQEWALLGPIGECYQSVSRDELPAALLRQVERSHQERGHG